MNRKSFYWLIGMVVALTVIVSAFYFDDVVRNYMMAHQSRGLKTFMRNVSRFGDWPSHLVLGLILVAIAWLRGNKRWLRIFLCMLIAFVLAGMTARVVKIATGRARPSVKTEEVVTGSRWASKFHAFPSGHTAASTAFFAVLFFVNWRIALACLPIPLLIGFSRMYVAAHYLSDVVCAAILGMVCAAISAWFLLKIRNPQSEIAN